MYKKSKINVVEDEVAKEIILRKLLPENLPKQLRHPQNTEW